MKVLSLSTDANIFRQGTAVRQRMIEYAKLVEELHIIIYTTPGFQKEKIGSNAFIYPTNTGSRWHYFSDGLKIAVPLLRKGIDVISAQEAMTGLLGWKLKRRYGVPMQLQIHTDFMSPKFRFSAPTNFLSYLAFLFLIPRADTIRVVSERIKNSVIVRFPKSAEKITLLPIFVDVRQFREISPSFSLSKKFPNFSFIFLAVSRLEPEKNISLLLEAFAEVKKKHQKVGLIIVGGGSLKSLLQAKVRQLGLERSVYFEGEQTDTVSYYKGANAFVCSSNFEGFGLTSVEAAASLCPVITTDVGLVGSVLDDESALIVMPESKNELAAAMRVAIEFPQRVATLTFRAAERLDQHLILSKDEYLAKYKYAWMTTARLRSGQVK